MPVETLQLALDVLDDLDFVHYPCVFLHDLAITRNHVSDWRPKQPAELVGNAVASSTKENLSDFAPYRDLTRAKK